MNEPPFDVQRAHRWFGVELNNLAWGLVEAEQRSTDDVERMIHAAHGACYHWQQVGAPVNHLRAQCLLATAYVRAGYSESAVRHAERCLSLSQEVGDAQPSFDRATANGCASAAYGAAGRIDEARAQYRLAKAAATTFTEADETQVFEQLYPAP